MASLLPDYPKEAKGHNHSQLFCPFLMGKQVHPESRSLTKRGQTQSRPYLPHLSSFFVDPKTIPTCNGIPNNASITQESRRERTKAPMTTPCLLTVEENMIHNLLILMAKVGKSKTLLKLVKSSILPQTASQGIKRNLGLPQALHTKCEGKSLLLFDFKALYKDLTN